jgi:uncharacterized protein (UPF0248 family)
MIPLHELLSRIRWDPVFGAADFEIGYYDRTDQRIVVIPLREVHSDPSDRFFFRVADDNGEIHTIPFHRVREVYRNGRLIWSRIAR